MCVDKLYLCLPIVSECGPPFFLVVEALVGAAFGTQLLWALILLSMSRWPMF